MRFLRPRHVDIPDSTVLLLMRLVVGAAFILHGWPKIQAPLSWMQPSPMDVAPFLQAVAAALEFGGGILLIAGLVTPIAALGLIAEMIAALALVHLPRGDAFVATAPGQSSFELPLVYIGIAAVIAVMGPGRWSLDALLFRGKGAHEAQPEEEHQGGFVESARPT